jgi:hypothetical protein
MKLATLVLLLSLNPSDQWTFFHPEVVREYSCAVQVVTVMDHSMASPRQAWTARAHAERDSMIGSWEMIIGVFPYTLKGRHEAEKICSKWMDEASTRVHQIKTIGESK